MINKKVIGIVALVLLIIGGAIPAFAASTTSSTQTVQVTVNPNIAIAARWAGGANNSTINLGSLDADGAQTLFTGGASGEQLLTYSNIKIDVYTKAAGNFANGTNSIALSNFLFRGGNVSTATAFTTSYFKIVDNWDKAPQGGSNIANIDLFLTVPFGTEPGNYTNTVYFSAVQHNAAAPTTP